MVYHVALQAGGQGGERQIDPPTWLVTLGPVGVACFFALSGFLLSRPYARAFVRKERLPDWPGYARDRFLRIYPLYAFLVVVMWIAAPWLAVFGYHAANFGDAIAHLLFVFPFTPPGSVVNLDPPMWTMSTDVQFYFVLPLLCAAIVDVFRPARRVWGYAVLVVLLIGLSILWRVAATPYVAESWVDVVARTKIFWQLPGMFTAFGGGMLGALVWERALDGRRRFSGFVALAVCVPLLVLALNMRPSGTGPYMIWNDVLAGGGAAALVLAGCSLLRAPWIENPVVRWAERLSYAIYLTHIYIVAKITHLTGQFHGWTFFYVTAAVSVLATAVIALPLYLFVERPFLQLKERLRAN